MPTPMQNLITGIRARIIEKTGKDGIDTCGFRSNVEQECYAKHPGLGHDANDPKNDGISWESWLYVRNCVAIVLQYGRMHSRGAQRITLKDHKFGRIRLVIYDTNDISVDVPINRQNISQRLEGELPRGDQNRIYSVQNAVVVERRNRRGDRRQIGHILNLCLNSVDRIGSTWNIENVNDATVSGGLVDRVALTLPDILKAAKSYCSNEGLKLHR